MDRYIACPSLELESYDEIHEERSTNRSISPPSPLIGFQNVSSSAPLHPAASVKRMWQGEVEMTEKCTGESGFRQQPHISLNSNRSVWRAGWRTPGAALGFYLISIGCAVVHLAFFLYLDRRIIIHDGSLTPSRAYRATTIPQGFVTTVSFLLVTAFRAALGAAVGICYTQYLWKVLRSHILKVGEIEDLFQIRTNILHFANIRPFVTTPVLAGIALFCWLIPIGMIYPPGALVIGLGTIVHDTSFNVSVLYDANYKAAHPGDPSTLMESFVGLAGNATTDEVPLSPTPAMIAPLQAKKVLQDAVESTLITGEIQNLHSLPGQNTTYNLQFWGPTLQCDELNRSIPFNVSLLKTVSDNSLISWDYNISTPLEGQNDSNDTDLDNDIIFAPKSEVYYQKLPDSFDDAGKLADFPMSTELDVLALTFRVSLNIFAEKSIWPFYPCPEDLKLPDMDSGYRNFSGLPRITVLAPTHEIICRPKLSKYHVNVTYEGGKQRVTHFTTDESPKTIYNPILQSFNGTVGEWLQLSDLWTIYNTFAQLLQQRTGFIAWQLENIMRTNVTERLSNGTTVDTCQFETPPIMPFSPDVPPEIFGTMRMSGSDWLWSHLVFATRNPYEDPVQNMITDNQRMLHEALANVTISAMALTGRYNMVDGTESQIINEYRFQRKLVFFLPYGLCLGIAAPMVILGLFALHQNGVTAISGGFVQIAMTTANSTSLRAIAAQGSLGGRENIPKELMNLKVRFGDVGAAEGEGGNNSARRRMGFVPS